MKTNGEVNLPQLGKITSGTKKVVKEFLGQISAGLISLTTGGGTYLQKHLQSGKTEGPGGGVESLTFLNR